MSRQRRSKDEAEGKAESSGSGGNGSMSRHRRSKDEAGERQRAALLFAGCCWAGAPEFHSGAALHENLAAAAAAVRCWVEQEVKQRRPVTRPLPTWSDSGAKQQSAPQQEVEQRRPVTRPLPTWSHVGGKAAKQDVTPGTLTGSKGPPRGHSQVSKVHARCK